MNYAQSYLYNNPPSVELVVFSIAGLLVIGIIRYFIRRYTDKFNK